MEILMLDSIATHCPIYWQNTNIVCVAESSLLKVRFAGVHRIHIAHLREHQRINLPENEHYITLRFIDFVHHILTAHRSRIVV